MNKEIIAKHLNKSLTGELTSISQYFLHSTILKDSGVNKLTEKMKNELDEELEHANKLAERILLLKGIPNFQDTNEISKRDGKFTKDTIRKISEDNLKLEEEGLKGYREAISVAE
ncbi:ferritin-like domain-containing protein [Wolbachia endosymbiont of Mansonella perstans]|uniref:ferritin-like domain-containing protein n=1 Tax=Wolbachia endosymbiont of Mansonella perstans TaxID=229526 RepID=UPI001CE1D468|nr:ferritin-like domain-containing protein [Wolbachia endosymbiont of Mansonella perstans]